jgi:O-antigen/teichoic acid export membrane protein
MNRRDQVAKLLRLLGSAVVMQALISGASLIAGLILIRRTTDLQYGYFVLMQNIVLLLGTLQGSFIQPQLVNRISRSTQLERADLVGGLYREQRRMWPLVPVIALLLAMILWFAKTVELPTVAIAIITGVAIVGTLYREFFRMVLLGHRQPLAVLRADAVFVVLLLGGILAATITPAPAAFAGVAWGLAALAGGALCARALWRFEPWNIRGAHGILWAIAPLGVWSAGGAAVHWLFSQGYNYLVAGMLSVPAVAGIAATRLTVMPVNLLSSGIGTMMLPTTAGWLNAHSAPKVFRRLIGFAFALAFTAICYFALMWLFRDWIFSNVLKKQFAQRDTLLLLWFTVALMMLFRDQLGYLLVIRHRFQSLTSLTLVSAVASLAVSYFSIPHAGIIGALWGVLAGELVNVAGLIALSIIEARLIVPVVAA